MAQGFGNFGDVYGNAVTGDVITANLPRSTWGSLTSGFSSSDQLAAGLRARGFQVIQIIDSDTIAGINPFSGGLTVVVKITASSQGTVEGVLAAVTQAAISAGYPIDYGAVTGGVTAQSADAVAQRQIDNINKDVPGPSFLQHLAGTLGVSESSLIWIFAALAGLIILPIVLPPLLSAGSRKRR